MIKPQMVLKLGSAKNTKEPKRLEYEPFVRKKYLRSRKKGKYVRPTEGGGPVGFFAPQDSMR